MSKFQKTTSADLSVDEAAEVIDGMERLKVKRGDDPDKSKGKAARAAQVTSEIADYIGREPGADDGE